MTDPIRAKETSRRRRIGSIHRVPSQDGVLFQELTTGRVEGLVRDGRRVRRIRAHEWKMENGNRCCCLFVCLSIRRRRCVVVFGNGRRRRGVGFGGGVTENGIGHVPAR